MKYILFLVMFLQGCLIVLDEECDPYHPDYEYTETDCYWTTGRVRVCNEYYCWNESIERQVCDEYHVCRDGVWVR